MSDSLLSIKALYFKAREKVRRNQNFNRWVYLTQSLLCSNLGSFRAEVKRLAKQRGQGEGLALCCRIRDEAPFLAEWVEYYLAAGVDHFFFYEKLSSDNFQEVLQPFIDRGTVTLFRDWAHVPVSPSAEQDCIRRSIGRFRWVGFIDADEFVVVRGNKTIADLLAEFRASPALALHWYMFGSSGHKERPIGPVIAEYNRRAVQPNRHVKCFVRPERVASYRNSHSWFYAGMECAVNENLKPVMGSTSLPPTAASAWINHYHWKSDSDYFAKAARKSVVDAAGINFNYRSLSRRLESDPESNAVVDDAAMDYYLARCRLSAREPILNRIPTTPLEIAGY